MQRYEHKSYPKMIYPGGVVDAKKGVVVADEVAEANQLKAWGDLDQKPAAKKPEPAPPAEEPVEKQSEVDDDDLSDMTLPELKAMADLRGLEYPKKIRKDDLIAMLEEGESE